MKSITVPLPESGILESQDGPDSALAKWLGSLHEALKPLNGLVTREGGEVEVYLRNADGSGKFAERDREFLWGPAANQDGEASDDSSVDGLWVFYIRITRVNESSTDHISGPNQADILHFYLGDFEGEGRVAKAKLTLALEIIMKRLTPPPTGFSSRLADILTLLRS
ncbi:MAG TPA: hypothetical protein PK295_02515 [Candidatus Magasanikbacteria bacterium]|nr:hypothetical protein [Candidatus Magasanikbacteria bacterium]